MPAEANIENAIMYSPSDNGGGDIQSPLLTLNTLTHFQRQTGNNNLVTFFEHYASQNPLIFQLVNPTTERPASNFLSVEGLEIDTREVKLLINTVNKMQNLSLTNKFALLVFVLWQKLILRTTLETNHLPETTIQHLFGIEQSTYDSCMRQMQGSFVDVAQAVKTWSSKLYDAERMKLPKQAKKTRKSRGDQQPTEQEPNELSLEDKLFIKAVSFLDNTQDFPVEEKLLFLLKYRLDEYRYSKTTRENFHKQSDLHMALEFGLPIDSVQDLRESFPTTINPENYKRFSLYIKWQKVFLELSLSESEIEQAEYSLSGQEDCAYWMREVFNDELYDRYSWEQFTTMAIKLKFPYYEGSFIATTSRLKRLSKKLIKLRLLDPERGERETVRIKNFQDRMQEYIAEGLIRSDKLAELVGVSRRTIDLWKGQLDLSVPREGRMNTTNTKLLQAIQESLEGLEGKITNREIADALQRSNCYTDMPLDDLIDNVKRFLDRYKAQVGVSPRRNPNLTNDQQQAIDELALTGKRPAEIARKLTIDPGNVAYYLRNRNK